MQNRENTARTRVTASFGVPSQMRVLDSWSYFFITASRSIGSWGTVFFLNMDIVFYLPGWIQLEDKLSFETHRANKYVISSKAKPRREIYA